MSRLANLVIFILGISSASVFGQSAQERQKHYNTSKGLAIEGYDPVSYFIGNPSRGSKILQYEYKGLVYRFATETNKSKFITNPEIYEPQYGGWCAYAMGTSGEKVEVDPETYKIAGNKLYLFYNKYFNNTLKSWNKDEAHLKTTADLNWKKYK